MSDLDDFNYDSVVSDPGVYTGFLNATAANSNSSSSSSRQADTNLLLTPAATTARAETPPPRHDYGSNDSMPSLAVSTPSSEKFHIEFEHERTNNLHQLGNVSTQSQFGLKSGMYNNRPADATESTTDFSAK
ncbi:hypothetical protein IWW47_001974 [Coemansia sp. RSA 2052]|nr:hypothetical protein IWW47_001974 [Coemansia sp. RSA 2052]